MSSPGRQRQLAFAISALGHVLLVLLLIVGIPFPSSQQAAGLNVIPIETVMIDEAVIEAEMTRLAAEEQAAIDRQLERERIAQQQQAELERQQREAAEAAQRERDNLARIRRETEQAEQAARDAEQERIRLQAEAQAERDRIERELAAAEAERQRIAAEEAARIAEQERIAREQAEAERRAAEERRRQEAELAAQRARAADEVARAIAAEEAARAAANAGLREQWALLISRRVEQRWIRPPNVTSALECRLIVTQLPDGTVIEVAVDQCNTSDQNIIRSLENAVLNASPLPPRPQGVEFERIVRIRFKPTD